MTATLDERRRKVKKLAAGFGVPVADTPVCAGHSAPLDFLTGWVYDRPALSVVHGPRGGGKSYLAALATHVDGIRYDFQATKILGGSLAQSQQIYNALRDFDRHRPGFFAAFTRTAAQYTTGSEVSILAASSTSVRGPHVATLRLDEVDEIDDDIRDAAVGMCMGREGVAASISMTSTWHNVGGPMGRLREQADALGPERFPWHTFCAFEILERCPPERSGPRLEHCPACPLMPWCHEDMDRSGGVPKAKRSNGHYPIDSLAQKVAMVSVRAFESDYLCRGPKADGVWFTGFDEAKHVGEDAEYDPALPVHLALDSGVHTGAVFYQVRVQANGLKFYSVFADYLSEGLTARANALAVRETALFLCRGQLDYRHTDPAGGARNPIGPTVLNEYTDEGLPLDPWPRATVADGLAMVEAVLEAADRSTRISVHPRCVRLIAAFRNYRRKKAGGQWTDRPEDPQHPHEDVMDALRGGLIAEERGGGSWGYNPLS